MVKAPTMEQRTMAEDISMTLGIVFPTCSEDFTARAFDKFIENHLDTFYEVCAEYEAYAAYNSESSVVWNDIL